MLSVLILGVAAFQPPEQELRGNLVMISPAAPNGIFKFWTGRWRCVAT